ncbi:hypothetical protein ACG02S_01110 [Roseateles sp. DC23W]|uniref:Toxin CptA n=1 Tax=Pelomonas dachongensis TaxID=3299029 RepID=A0ABW7EJK0_9BURK
MRSTEALLRRMLMDARDAAELWCPRLQPHPAALVSGLAGAALGVFSHRQGSVLLGWLALALCVIGMALYATLHRDGIGWRLQLATPPRIEPVGVDGEARTLDGAGWSVCCVGGIGRRTLALEFRHADGGKPLRVFQTRTGANRAEHQLTSQLADTLSARLHMGRQGLSL